MEFTIWQIQEAAHGVNGEVLKSHITAATMALLYNWLDSNLLNNRLDVPGLKEMVCRYFDEARIKELIIFVERENFI